jgi:hypothetical protein
MPVGGTYHATEVIGQVVHKVRAAAVGHGRRAQRAEKAAVPSSFPEAGQG